VAVNGTFDDCQTMVKQAFDDQELRQTIGLNSANSINISRLMAQICYYFEALAQIPQHKRDQVVVAVPSGNFGNLTAGLIAKAMGLPIKRFIAATNANDTVPRYLASGQWQPQTTVATLSNAMDVSQPNNWPRIEELFRREGWALSELASGRADDAQTAESLTQLAEQDYLCEPHGAIAYRLLAQQLGEEEEGIFLCTAHPAKFKESVDAILHKDIPLPGPLAKHAQMDLLSSEQETDFSVLRAYLLNLSA
jgi:threonine synthase